MTASSGPLRIGLVTGEYPPLPGGVGDFTRALGRALAERGHQVVVITDVRAGPQSDDGLAVAPVIPSWDLRAAGTIARLAAERDLDVVNLQYQAAAYGMGLPIHAATLVWRAARRPFARVVTFHDLRVPYLFRGAGPLRWQVVRLLGGQSDAVIVTNVADARVWPGRARVVPIGSNISPCLPLAFARDEWRARYGADAGTLLIAFFGFLNASKGVDTLVEALATLVAAGRPARLLLVGEQLGASDPTNRAVAAALEVRIAALGLADHVRATGFLPAAEVSAALAAADLVALPYRDGASLRRGTLMAALAHGCAIVTTEPVDPLIAGAVAVVPADDPAALAGRLAELGDDPAGRAALGRAAAAAAAAFGWEPIAALTLDVYAAALARRRGRRA